MVAHPIAHGGAGNTSSSHRQFPFLEEDNRDARHGIDAVGARGVFNVPRVSL